MISVNITAALLTAMIISMIILAIIHKIENEISELRRFALDLKDDLYSKEENDDTGRDN